MIKKGRNESMREKLEEIKSPRKNCNTKANRTGFIVRTVTSKARKSIEKMTLLESEQNT